MWNIFLHDIDSCLTWEPWLIAWYSVLYIRCCVRHDFSTVHYATSSVIKTTWGNYKELSVPNELILFYWCWQTFLQSGIWMDCLPCLIHGMKMQCAYCDHTTAKTALGVWNAVNNYESLTEYCNYIATASINIEVKGAYHLMPSLEDTVFFEDKAVCDV